MNKRQMKNMGVPEETLGWDRDSKAEPHRLQEG